MSIQDQTRDLLKQQATEWPLLAENLKGLKTAKTRHFPFKDFSFNIQFNPSRIVSSAAKVDKKSIQERKCFLCSENRPPEQRSVKFSDTYEILCNPFPIFSEHFTIAGIRHLPQAIGNAFGEMLEISRALPGYVVFYNAPNCGASAPDHIHFQAGNRGLVPVEHDIEELKVNYGSLLYEGKSTNVYAVDDGLRKFFVAESSYKEIIDIVFNAIYSFSQKLNPQEEEPMLNILCWYHDGWQVMFFIRGKHRPWQYFAEDEENILLSPASVDMGGTLITPLEKDFSNITKEDITDIFEQVSMPKEDFDQCKRYLGKQLSGKW